MHADLRERVMGALAERVVHDQGHLPLEGASRQRIVITTFDRRHSREGDLPAAGDIGLIAVVACHRDGLAALHVGFDHFLVAPVDPEALIATVAALERRIRRAAPAEARRVLGGGGLIVDLDRRTVICRGEACHLTRCEFDLLAALMAADGRALSRSELQRSIWDYLHGPDGNIAVHVSNLRRKIERDASEPALIKTVRGIGYRFDPDAL